MIRKPRKLPAEQCSQNLGDTVDLGSHYCGEQTHKVMKYIKQLSEGTGGDREANPEFATTSTRTS